MAPKIQAPAAPTAAAPVVQPLEAPKLEIGGPALNKSGRRRGTSQLRIDSTVPRPDVGSGLNVTV